MGPMLRTSTVLLLLSISSPGDSQAEPPPAVQVQARSGAQALAEIRPEYIQGEPILIPMSLINSTPQQVEVPDLAARPWLVEFHLVLPSGNDQVRKNSAPEADTGTSVRIAPRGQRRMLMEIPASSNLKSGDYSLEVQIILGEERLVLPSQDISIVPAHPVSADLSPQQHPGSKTEPLSSLWVHKARQGHDLFLHQAQGARPGRVLRDRFLTTTSEKIQPRLSATRSRELGNAHVTWQTGPQTLHILHLSGSSSPPSGPSQLELPWPRVEVEDRGITVSNGELHLPLWIPAPRGQGGTLQLVRVDERGRPIFERVAHFERRPELSLSMIDDAGQPHLLLVHSGNLDRYSPRLVNASGKNLPVPGTRLLRSRSGHRVIDLQVVTLPEQGSRAGGLSLLLTTQHEAQLHHSWVGLGGAVLQEKTQSHPAGRVEAVVANGWNSPGIAEVDAEGQHWLIDGGRRSALELAPDGDWQLYRSADGAVHLRQAMLGGPIGHQRVAP